MLTFQTGRYYTGEQGSREMLLNPDLGLKVNVLLRKVAAEIVRACVFHNVLRIFIGSVLFQSVGIYVHT